MARGCDGPAARRVRNLNHLWVRLRDFYQVRGFGRGGWVWRSLPGGPPSTSSLLCPQEELQLLILSPPPDLQTLESDPFSGALSYHPFLLLSPHPTPNFLWPVLCRGGSGGVGRHPPAVAGGVSAGEQGREGRVQLWPKRWETPVPACPPCLPAV